MGPNHAFERDAGVRPSKAAPAPKRPREYAPELRYWSNPLLKITSPKLMMATLSFMSKNGVKNGVRFT